MQSVITAELLTQLLNKPIILWITVMVLCGSQGVSYSLDTVHNRTSEIVCGIHSVKKEIHHSQYSNTKGHFRLGALMAFSSLHYHFAHLYSTIRTFIVTCVNLVEFPLVLCDMPQFTA